MIIAASSTWVLIAVFDIVNPRFTAHKANDPHKRRTIPTFGVAHGALSRPHAPEATYVRSFRHDSDWTAGPCWHMLRGEEVLCIMRRSRKILVAAGFTAILGAQAVFTILLATPDGIRIKSPERTATVNRKFVVSGDAWMKGGISAIEVLAEPANAEGTSPLRFSAARDEVRYRGRALYPLSSWSAPVDLPSDGKWKIWARAGGLAGDRVETPTRVLPVAGGFSSRAFRPWSSEHLIPIALIVVVAVGLGFLARRGGRRSQAAHSEGLRAAGTVTSPDSRAPASRGRTDAPPSGGRSIAFERVALGLTIAVWTNEIIYQIYWFSAGGWSVSTALMIQMCGLSILLFPVAFFAESERVRQFLFDLLYFWGIGGAIQALIAPDIGANGFPDYRYFSFFVSHGLIITSAVLMVMAGGVRITLRSVLRAVVVTNLLLIPIYGIDMAIKLIPPYDPGNYFVLGFPPPTGSIVDLFSNLFGPSPRYVVGLEAMGLLVFALLYVPWPVARWIRRGTAVRRLPASG